MSEDKLPVDKAVLRLMDKERDLPSREKYLALRKMQMRVEKKNALARSGDTRGLIGTCANAYRDKNGNVMCGRSCRGIGFVFKQPFEQSCARNCWKPRGENQPPIFKTEKQNLDFAKRVRMIEMGQKLGYMPKNALGFL